VTNCGFETGGLTGWVRGGDTNFTGVWADSTYTHPHSGGYHYYVGNSDEGTLAQTFTTVPGQVYDVRFWVFSVSDTGDYRIAEVDPDASGPDSWGSPPLLDLGPLISYGYREYTGTFTATGSEATLRFRYRNAWNTSLFDDVSVVARAGAGPTVTIDQASGQADPTSGSPVVFTVVFSEPVTGFATGDVSLSGTAGATTAEVSEVSPNDGTTYRVAVSGMSGSGTVIASISAGVATDGTNLNVASTSTDNTVTYNAPDISAPTVSYVTSPKPNGAYKAGTNIGVQVEFSEVVTVSGTPRLTLETGATDGVATYNSGSGSTSLFFAYTVQAGENSYDLDYVSTAALTLNGGSIEDAAGNDAVLTLPSPGWAGSLGANKAIVIDTSAPTVTIDQASGQADPTSGSPVDFTVVFSEPVTGFATGDVSLSGTAGATTAEVSEVSPNDGTTYRVAVSGMSGSGTVIASISAGVATDGTNLNLASTSTDNTVTYNAATGEVAAAIAALRADVVALGLGKTGDRLLNPLDRAASAVQSGKPTAALRQMDSFSKTVDSLRNKTVLTQADADHLKAHVTEIVTMLQP
jgi:hypothetical protein